MIADNNPTCPQCNGQGAYMGTLGTLDWFRCIQCGWEFATTASTKEDQ